MSELDEMKDHFVDRNDAKLTTKKRKALPASSFCENSQH